MDSKTPEPIQTDAGEKPEPDASKGATPSEDTATATGLKAKVIEVLKTCFDPEIPVNIYELGLIYEIQVVGKAKVDVKMTLTSPMCPVAGSLPPEVEQKIRDLEGVDEVKVDLVWDPPWEPARMTEAAKLQLNMF